MLPQVPQRERVGEARRMFAALREAELAFEVLYLGVAILKYLLFYAKFRHLGNNNENPLLRQQLNPYLKLLSVSIPMNCLVKNELTKLKERFILFENEKSPIAKVPQINNLIRSPIIFTTKGGTIGEISAP